MRKYHNSDGGYMSHRFYADDGSLFLPDWDASLYIEFRDADGALQFTATTISVPPIEADSDAEGDFIKVNNLDLSAFAVGVAEARVYAKYLAVSIEPDPAYVAPFEVLADPAAGYLADLDLVRELGNIPEQIEDDYIVSHFRSAQRRLVKWLGADAYADALLVAPAQPDRADAMREAEALLVIHYALPALSRRLAASGNFQSGNDGAGSGWSLKTQADVEREQQLYLDRAEETLADWLAVAPPGIFKVEADDETE